MRQIDGIDAAGGLLKDYVGQDNAKIELALRRRRKKRKKTRLGDDNRLDTRSGNLENKY